MFKNIYVIGVFDLFHRGHVEFLKSAKSMGENLIVAINGDEMVTEYKRKPFYSENDRLAIIQSCKYVDQSFIIKGYDNKEYLEKYKIDAIVHGNDWEREGYLKQIRVTEEYLKEKNTQLLLIPYTAGISTSQLIKLIKEN